jgi:hypothetical protein
MPVLIEELRHKRPMPQRCNGRRKESQCKRWPYKLEDFAFSHRLFSGPGMNQEYDRDEFFHAHRRRAFSFKSRVGATTKKSTMQCYSLDGLTCNAKCSVFQGGCSQSHQRGGTKDTNPFASSRCRQIARPNLRVAKSRTPGFHSCHAATLFIGLRIFVLR